MTDKNETNGHVTNNDTLHDLSSIAVLICAIIGIIGNALTLCAFKYAQINKKFPRLRLRPIWVLWDSAHIPEIILCHWTHKKALYTFTW